MYAISARRVKKRGESFGLTGPRNINTIAAVPTREVA